MAVPDYRQAINQAEEDGDDVAVQSAEAAIAMQTENMQKFETSEHEDWMMRLDVQYINACKDVEELHKIVDTMEEEGFVGLKLAAESRLSQISKKEEAKVDVDALFADLDEWTMVASEQDAELVKSASAGAADAGGPGIRKGAMVKPAEPEHKPLPKAQAGKKGGPGKYGGQSARHTYDNYQDKWDKWDNANFIEEITAEEEEREKQEEAERKVREEKEGRVAKAGISDAVRKAPIKKPMSSVERRIMADKEKEKGNECFKTGEYETAVAYYTRGLELNPDNAIILANRAMAHLRLDRPADSVKDCDAALQADPTYNKALFRRGLAQKALERWADASEDLKAALGADPDNRQILKELTIVEGKMAEARKNRFRRMAVEEVDEGDGSSSSAAPSAPPKVFKKIVVEEGSDSEEESSSEEEEEVAAPPIEKSFTRITVAEDSDETDSDEEDAPAQAAAPKFTRIAIADSDDDSSDSEEEQQAAAPPIAKSFTKITVEEGSSSSDDDDDDDEVTVAAPPAAEVDTSEALKIKGEGNLHFKSGRYEQAIGCYTKSLDLLPLVGGREHPEAAKVYSNRAACRSQMGDHRQVVADSTAALAVVDPPDPTAIKALMRRGYAYEAMEKFEFALADMRAVVQHDRTATEAGRAVQRLSKFVAQTDKLNGGKKKAATPPVVAPAPAKRSAPAEPVKAPLTRKIVVEEDSDDESEGEEDATAQVEALKAQGNAAFKAKDYTRAVNHYSAALNLCVQAFSSSVSEELVVSLHNNRAMTQLKLSEWQAVLGDCEYVLRRDKTNVKALYRQGQANQGLGLWSDAIASLKQVVKLQPANKAAKAELEAAEAKVAASSSAAAAPGPQNAPKKKGGGMKIEEVELPAAATSASGSSSSPTAASPPKIAPFKAPVPSLPSGPPATSTQFEQQFHRLRKHPALFAQYLVMIPATSLPKIFKSSMTVDILNGIVECLTTSLVPDGFVAEAYAMLRQIVKVPRMATTSQMMTKGEREKLERLLGFMQGKGHDAAAVRPGFGL